MKVNKPSTTLDNLYLTTRAGTQWQPSPARCSCLTFPPFADNSQSLSLTHTHNSSCLSCSGGGGADGKGSVPIGWPGKTHRKRSKHDTLQYTALVACDAPQLRPSRGDIKTPCRGREVVAALTPQLRKVQECTARYKPPFRGHAVPSAWPPRIGQASSLVRWRRLPPSVTSVCFDGVRPAFPTPPL